MNGICNLLDLLADKTHLPLFGKRNLLKLAVTDDHGVITAKGNPATEFLPVSRLEIPLRCHQDVGSRVKLQKFCSPLLNQVVWHHKKTLLA